MSLRILALLTLAVASSALEVDPNFLAGVADNLHDYLSSHLRNLVKEHARPELPTSAGKNTTCGACVQEGSKFVIEHTVKKMTEKCSNITKDGPGSCILGKVCGLMGKHPKVVVGMMIEHVRPLSLATAYCTGKGACEKPDSVTMEEIAMGEEPHEALLNNFDKVDWSDVEEQTEEIVAQPEIEMGENDAPACEEMKKHLPVKPKCMKKSMRHVMGFAVMKVKGMCANVDKIKCPVMKKMCPWMAQNKEVTLGMLIAKVEPWKFGLGFCFHKKMHHGRHGHHGGWHPHHGHGDWHPHHGPHRDWHPHHGPHGDRHPHHGPHGDRHPHHGPHGDWHPHHGSDGTQFV